MIKSISKSREYTKNLCRLCLNKELLQDVHKEQDLQRWISDFLAIVISIEDRMSQAICGMCRMRLIEFHHFRVRCQEVQDIFKSMIKKNDDKSLQSEMRNTVVKLEYCPESVLDTHQGRADQIRSGQANGEKEAGVETVGIEDIIVLEEVKIEARDEDEESPQLSLNKTVTESNCNGESQAFERDCTSSAIAKGVQTRDSSDNTLNRCNICHKEYQTRRKLEFHLKSAHGSKDHKCLTCGVRFFMLKALTRHQCSEKHLNTLSEPRSKANTPLEKIQKRSKTEHNKLQKQDCTSETKPANENLPEIEKQISEKNGTDQSAITSSNNNKGYTCSTCDRSFQRKGQLKNHSRSHKEQVAEDLSIDMETIRLSRLSRLTVQLPNIDDIGQTVVEGKENVKGAKLTAYQCEICSKQLKSYQRLHNHMRNHQPKEHVCKHCRFSFSRRDNLQRHLKTHAKSIFDRPERAESDETLSDEDAHSKENESDRSSVLASKSDKERHYIGRLQPFQCNSCYKECKTAQNLRYHMRSVHGPKNHVCLTCGVRFSKRNNLKKHLRTKVHLDKLVNNSLRNKLSVTLNEYVHEKMTPRKPNKAENASPVTSAKREVLQSPETTIKNDIAKKDTSTPVEHSSVVTEERDPTDNSQEGYFCLICNRLFNRLSKLTNHMRVHEEPASGSDDEE